MSMMVSFVLSFFPRDVLDEILNLIESVSEDFPSYSFLISICFHLSDDTTVKTYSYWEIKNFIYFLEMLSNIDTLKLEEV